MSEQHYGPLSKLLHRLALGNSLVAKASFDLEQTSRKFDGETVKAGRHVFIAGLARAGTTILMRLFYSTGVYRSLIYRDMPFVLMPYLWNRVRSLSTRDTEKRERAHGDGIAVDFDSPEALEEAFWRVFCGDRYIGPDHLRVMTADYDLLRDFRRYVAAVLASGEISGQDRYLSKNNNNVLRLASIRRAFPNATVIIPFRDPLQQAFSLLGQHRRFVDKHANDEFVRRYMTWLGHHEFGADHKPFHFGSGRMAYGDPDNLNYWLELWLNTYSWLVTNAPQEVLFVCYESLCEEFERVWGALRSAAEIPRRSHENEVLTLRTASVDEEADLAVFAEANALYRDLKARAV